MNRIRNEKGIALAVAIFALVVIGGLVSAAFFVGVQEQRVGRNTVKAQQAFSAAEAGSQAIINGWNTTTYNVLARGASITFDRTALASSGGWYRGSIMRINTELFLVQAEGFSLDSTARQKVGVVIRLRPLELNVNAALKSRGNITLGGNAFIDGRDHPPTGWSCPPQRDTIPAIRVTAADSAAMTFPGCGGLSCLAGDPKIKSDPSISDSSLSHFGDVEFQQLATLANKFPGNGTLTGLGPQLNGLSCNYSHIQNWGDPTHIGLPCSSYFPIIWIDGDARITGNTGQGVLIVNGNLEVSGGFEFYGPVIINGSLTTTGTGGHFNGGVIARNVNLAQESILGSAVVNYSSCALSKALNGSSVGSAMRERGWINMF